MNSHVPENPEALLDELIRSDFVTFLRRAFLGTSPANEFKHGWYIDALAHYLDRLADGEIERLVVNLPPRHLKSITVSVAWVAFMLGINPKLKFVCVSYSETVSLIFANLCRQIMETEWYCRAFPHTRLDPKRNKEDHFYTTAGGYRYSTSVGGSLTGIGGDIIIVDDPIKAEDAHSETIRRNCLEWYRTTLCSRTDDRNNSAFVFVMQRLHQDDLAGYVEDNDECEVVKFPAIATHDERIPVGGGKFYQRRKGNALNPAHMNIQQLRREQQRIGDMAFSSQYQQDPISPEGNIFKSSWLILHDSPPDRANGGYIIQSWDTAGRNGINNDYSVGITAHVCGHMVYVLDVFRAKLTYPDLKAKIIELAQAWKTDVLAIEDAGSGMYLLDQLRREPIMHVLARMPCVSTRAKLRASRRKRK